MMLYRTRGLYVTCVGGGITLKPLDISRIKSQNINVSRLVLQLSLSNPLKPGVIAYQGVTYIVDGGVKEISGKNKMCKCWKST